jgi:glycosyltransferase involved in cell wall biosynthesis
MTALRVLVWQWGRRGAGPRFAVELAESLRGVPGVTALLSLSGQSEQLLRPNPPEVALPYATYDGLRGYLWRMLTIPFQLPRLMRALRQLRPDVAVCAMPAPLDLLMGAALRRLGVPFFVLVHDADAHPGDAFPLQMKLQRRLVRRAAGLITLSNHVARRLMDQGEVGQRPMIALYHPPFAFGPPTAPPRSHGGPLRLLFFGRLLPYKGLDLFAAALRRIGPRADITVRVVGQGPETAALNELRGLQNVVVENRWVPEDEIASLLAWADALVLSHTEASQSGVAAAAIAARRWLVATRVGGLVEQLQTEPQARMCDPTVEGLATAILQLIADPPPTWSANHDSVQAWSELAATLAARLRSALERPFEPQLEQSLGH